MNCQVCQTANLEWSENVNRQGKHYLYNVNTGQPHDCKPVLKPNPIARFDNMNGILFDRRPESLAKAITDEAVKSGLDPYKVRVELRGQFIILH